MPVEMPDGTTLNDLYDMVSTIDKRKTWAYRITAASLALLLVAFLVIALLAAVLASRNGAIDRIECRDRVNATWQDKVGTVIVASSRDDAPTLLRSIDDLADDPPLPIQYDACAQSAKHGG